MSRCRIRFHAALRPTVSSVHSASWLALSLLSVAIGSAHAQSAPAPASAASAANTAAAPKSEDDAPATSTLETVTISATRRRELIREVPLAISSVSAERLQETGAKSLNDYLATQPGIVLQNSGAADNSGSIVIRGLTAGIDSNSPTTVYLDDTPLGPGTTFDLNLMDLRKLEVLRGPQGTLYGASAMGGVVKYVTNDPETDELWGRVGVGFSQTRNGGLNSVVNGLVNVPIKQDVAAARVAVFGSRDAGYVDATGPLARENVNKKDDQGARISVLLTPTRELSLKFNAITQTHKSDGNDRVSYDYATREPAAGDLVYRDLVFSEPRKSQRDLYATTIDYDFVWARLTSVTSWQKSDDHLITDFSGLAAAFGLDRAYVDNRLADRRTTQELRLVSQTGQMFDWLVGAYFNKAKSNSAGLTQVFSGPTSFALQDDHQARDFQEEALYGNVTWNATPAFALTAGLRVAHYKQTDVIQQLNASDKSITFDESPKTYLATAKYRLTPQSNVYFRAANGYRPGGANFDAVDQNNKPVPGAPKNYGTDTAWTYEAGYKATLSSNASFEAAVFDTEWKDLQQVTRTLLGGFTSNLGKARIRGIEAGATVEPLKDLSFGLTLSLLDPKLLTDSEGLGGKAGDRLPNSPKVAANFTSRYAFSLSGHRSFAALNASYVGNRYSSFAGSPISPNFVMPAYVQLDLAGGVKLGRFDAGLYVRNLTDKRAIIGADTSQTATVGLTTVKVITPRTVGVNLAATF